MDSNAFHGKIYNGVWLGLHEQNMINLNGVKPRKS